jgi:hypothetical protein
MTQKKIFDELDHLIGNKLMVVNLGMGDLADFLERKNISLNEPMREPLPGEKSDDVELVGDVLIRMALSMSKFLIEYKEIKETWQVTTA